MHDHHEIVEFIEGPVHLDYAGTGTGQTFLLLHGGAGPGSMAGLAAELAGNNAIILPTHPGFDGKPREQWFISVRQLAALYIALLDRLDLKDVVIIGNSVGGWIAAEMALQDSLRISGLVLLNAVGIAPGAKPIVDPMVVSPAERAALAFHAPDRFAAMPSTPDAAQRMVENQATLRVYAGQPFMHDPALEGRLNTIDMPALVLWGESDGIVDVDYGWRFADAFPKGRFEPIEKAGHFPQIEQCGEVVRRIQAFVH